MRSQKAKHVREPMVRVSDAVFASAITLLVIDIEIPNFAGRTCHVYALTGVGLTFVSPIFNQIGMVSIPLWQQPT